MRLSYFATFLVPFLPGLIRAQAPAAPTEVVAYAPNQNQVNLSWKDNATDETGYRVEIDTDPGVGETWVAKGNLVRNTEVFRSEVFPSAAQEVRYRVAAVKSGEYPNWVVAEVVKAEGGLRVARVIDLPPTPSYEDHLEGAEARVGIPFSFQIEVLGNESKTFTASALPTGVMVNSQNGLVSGTIAQEGVYRCFVGVSFDGGKKFEQVKYIRVLPAPSTPVVVNPSFRIPPLGVEELVRVDLANLFKDPARNEGVLISTLGESIILALHDKATPKTVANFLGYVQRGDYANSFLHRSVAGFIIQGGGARPSALPNQPAKSWANIPVQAAVPNEPGISNERGTIAMAKMGGDPDSATSEWFLSTGSNTPSILNPQNGGFSAFGQIVGTGSLGVALALNELPVVTTYQNLITGTSGTELGSIPVLQNPPPAVPGPDTFVRITSITRVAPIEVSISAITPGTILDAAVSGTDLYVQSMGPPGVATLTLRATNADGNVVDFPVRVEVIDSMIPGIGLTSLKRKGVTSILIKGRAGDNDELSVWKYRINKKGWKRGGRLNGRFARFSKIVKGFRRGKNVLEVQAFDRSGNGSVVLTQKFTLQ